MKNKVAIQFALIIMVAALLPQGRLAAQEDSIPAKPVYKLRYYNQFNSEQYLLFLSALKKNKVLTPQALKTYTIFMDSVGPANQVSVITTDAQGKGKAFIPPTLKSRWDASEGHTFIVMEGDEEILSDYAIRKAKLTLDTSVSEEGVRTIAAKVQQLEGNAWVPVKDVELKVGIARLGSILSAGEEATYTTDSSGTALVELKRDSMPGDAQGNLTIAARIDDNETFGNLLVEKVVPWGVPTKVDNSFFDQRALWATRFRTPVWLLFMAYFMMCTVWGTLFYLIWQIVKIKKIGLTEK